MAETLVIQDVTLIDGTGAPAVENATVVAADGRITAAGAAAGVSVPSDAEVIEGRGLWAIPGLIDTHVHVELVGTEALPLFLALGLTTIRDLGGALGVLSDARRSLEDGAPGPRLLFTGPMIDGEPPTWPTLVRSTPDAQTAASAVREHLEAGVDAIKLYTTLPPESLRRCIDEVAGRVPVTGHLGLTPASEAIEAGISGLEHALLTPYNDFAPRDLRTGEGEGMTSPGFWQKVQRGWLQADFESDRSKEWIELLVRKDVSFCPTLTVLPGAGDEPGEEELRHAPRVAERWLEATRQRQAMRLPPEAQERGRRVRAKLQELVARVNDAGGRVVAGTDTGAVRSLVPGYSLHKELGFLSEAGLSNMDVLRAATSHAAEALGRVELGTIEAGKEADLLLLGSDPLLDVGALRDIRRIVQGGRVLDPAELLPKPGGPGDGGS